MTTRAAHGPLVLGAARGMALDHAAGTVTVALAEAGVPAILLKGPAVAQWLYDDGAPRPYADVDLLVRPGDWPTAGEVLGCLGFRQQDEWLHPAVSEQGEHAATWSRPDGRVVDLHWSMVGVTVPSDVVWQVLSRQRTTIRLGDFEVEILARPALALQIVLHALQHGVSERQPIEDLARLIERASDDDWQQAAQHAATLGATESFAAGLRLVPEGHGVAHRLHLPATVSTAVVLRGSARRGRGAALGIEALLETRTARDRARVLRRRLLPGASHMRVRHPIARRGRTGLTMAYAWRILTLGPRSAAGLWAWRRARRVARRERISDPPRSDVR